jgi:hypothetical protein
MLKRLILILLSVLLLLAETGAASYGQTITLRDNGVISGYAAVPNGFRCNVEIPDMPTAFCAGPGARVYHKQMNTTQNPVDSQQLFHALLQQASSESNLLISQRYSLPEITYAILQRDSQLLFVRGQQVTTYAADIEDLDLGRRSVLIISIRNVPNNGAPIAVIEAFGISLPTESPDSYDQMRNELIRFVQSHRYDDMYVQTLNARTLQFEGNLAAKNQAFQQNQSQIHQRNMNALDQQFDSYRRNAAEMDRSLESYMDNSWRSDEAQSRYIDLIHERQQLVDEATGQRYEADGYSDHNYVNPYDASMYYRTDDPLANPNVNLNQGGDYNRLEAVPYGSGW